MGLKFAQIGIGNWGKNIFRNFYNLNEVDMLAISDLDDGILKGLKANYPGVETTQNAQLILNNPAIDAVVIATVPETHFEFARQALENNKHVFVEKPMTLKSQTGEILVELAEKNRLKLMVGHILEYHPAYLKVKAYLDSGELGEVRYLYSTRVNLGVVRKKENALWSLAPHDISIALMLLGKNPSRVVCTGQSYLQPGIEDVAFAMVHFPNGKMAQLHVSWLDPHKIRKLTVVGSKKMVVLDDMESTEKIRLYDKGVDLKEDFTGYQEALTLRVGDIHIPKLTMQEPLKLECQHFVDSILNDTPPRSDGFDGLQVVKILEAADKSLKNHGEPVEIL